jgi:hypothetical protein
MTSKILFTALLLLIMLALLISQRAKAKKKA